MINVNIQILRGISVLLVLLFHLDIELFSFGYIGVDIFFLISGFLMPIILPKYNAFGFIKARFIRLFPALSVMILTTLILGYFFQMPGEYLNLAISSLTAFSFFSEFYFLFNTGYFDQESIYQPLLHTWSLGNEFLAYMLIFILLLLFSKDKLKNASLIIVILSAVYIIFSLTFFSSHYLDPVPRIFLFFSAFYLSSKIDEIKITDQKLLFISFISFILILIIFGKEIFVQSWPNYSIFLLPSLIIPLIFMKGTIVPFSFLNKFLFKIGDWSYSIYIWHWPVIVFERIYFRNTNINIKEAILLILISLALGVFSFLFIERKKILGYVSLIISLLLVCIILLTDGASYRVEKSMIKYSSIENMMDKENYISEETLYGITVTKVFEGVEDEKTIVIGDSHSQHILPILKEGYHGSIYKIHIQPDQLNTQWETIKKLLEDLKINKIIVAYRLHTKKINEIDLLIKNLNNLELNQKYKITILRDPPSFNGDPVACLISNHSDLMFKGCGFDIANGLPITKVFNRINPIWELILKQANNNIHLVDTHKKMCNETKCLTMINNEFILRDNNHFNEKLSKNVNERLYKLLFLSQ